MKTITTLLTLFLGFVSYSQSLDPRQFIDIKYSREKSDSSISIASWNNHSEIFQQKIDRIDIEGSLEISFLIDKLIADTNFFGAVSLEAELYGRDGSRKIEVNPYSLIGQDQTEYGINSISPSELANRLRLSKKAIADMRSRLDELRFYLQSNKGDTSDITYRITAYPFNSQTLNAELSALSSRLYMSPETIDKTYIISIKKKLKGLLIEEFDTDQNKKDINSFFASDDITQATYSDEAFHIFRFVDNLIDRKIAGDLYQANNTKIRTQISQTKQYLELINQYLNSIPGAGVDTKRTFLTLSQCDHITFTELLSRINSCLNLPTSDVLAQQQLWFDQYNITLKICEELFNKIDVHNDLAQDISRLIYSRLINARIDLKKENAQPGETLNISVLWNDGPDKTTKINLCRFSIDQTGAQFKIMDAFYLVERINQGKGDSLQSPSNFKGAGGASLMLTYYKNDLRSNSIQKDVLDNKCNAFWNTMNTLQPSFGLNVSYLDFDVSKDFEIGTGLCLGFFRNQLMFTYGINLHKTHENWYNASYFGVGFSFINIADNIRNK